MNWMLILFAAGCMAIGSGTRFDSSQTSMVPQQIVREGSFELDTSADKAFPLFSPEGERSWAQGWDPKPVYPPQATVEFKANSVFRVDNEQERSLWTIVEVDLRQHVAEYIYVVEGERLSRVRVQIEPLGENRCRVRVRYVHTATSEKGLQFVAGVTEEAYAQKMRHWQHHIAAAIH